MTWNKCYDVVDLDLEQADAAFSEPIPATMSRGSELEQETPAAAGKQSHKATMAGTQINEGEADPEVPLIGPETSTPLKKLSPSRSEVDPLAPPNASVPVLAPQHTHTHYNDFSGSSFQIIQDSNMCETQLSLVANPPIGNAKSSQVPKGNSQPVNLPNDLSLLFAKACHDIAKCLDEEGRLDELKLVMQLSCNDTTDTLLPDAHRAKTVVQLFQQATEPGRRMWHYLDYDFLIRLLGIVSSEKAKKTLQDYDEHLLLFCEEELSALVLYKESPVPPEKAWMDVKWNGDRAKFKLGKLYECKEFLARHLKIPKSSFVFHEAFPGCITLRWAVLTSSACAAIEAKLYTGCPQFLDAEMQIKLVCPVNPTDQFHNTSESLFFGNKEYIFSQRVPQYAQCPICLGILQNAVVTNCCHEALCLDCCEKAKCKSKYWDSKKCPICRCEDFQYTRSEFIDKRVVGNIMAKCCRCRWTGSLWSALSAKYHPCVPNTRSAEGDSQGKATEAVETITEDRQEEAAMAVALPQAACIESQDEFEEEALVSEKEPLLEIVQTLLSHLRTLQMCVNDEALSSSGEHVSSAGPETLRDAVDEFTVLLQEMEENFLATEGSIVSGPNRRLSDAVNVAEEAQQCELAPGKVQSGNIDTAALSNLGLTASMEPPELDVISTDEVVEVHHHASVGDETFLQETPTQLAQSPERSTAQTALVREAQNITQLAAKAGQVTLLRQLLTATALSPDYTSYSGQSLLYTACQFGYADMARMLLSMRASVNLQGDNGRSPLHGAAYSGSLPCLELLLENDVEVNLSDLSGDTPLHTAAQQGHAAFAKMLMNHSHISVNKANACGQTPLHRASQGGNCEVIKLLLKSDSILNVADEEGFTPIHIAVKAGNTEAVKVLLDSNANPNLASSEHGLAPLHTAARQAEGLQLIQLLHAAGADIAAHDQKGRNVLHHAVKSSSLEIVQTVVEMGCPIDDVALVKLASNVETSKESLQVDSAPVAMEEWRGTPVVEDDMQSGGTTPLHLAILAQKADIVRYLLSKGASVHTTTKTGCAAIHMAVRSGEASLVKEIVEGGCDADLKTHDGLSPLHLAAQWGHKDVAMELIKARCDKELLTGGKRKSKAVTALLIAAMKLQPEMVQTLTKAGCHVQATTADGNNAIHLAVIAAQPTDYKSSVYRYVQYTTGRSRRHPAESEALKTITVLIRLGCDINAINADGQSPLDLAQRGYVDRYDHGYQYQHHHDCLDHALRSLGARTGNEMRYKATLSKTLDHATESAEGIELKLASRPKAAYKSRKMMRRERQTWSVAISNQVPSSYNLSRLVVLHVSQQWRDIGINLEINPDRLDEAAADCRGDELECCMKVFQFWLNGEGKGPKTWDTVLDVLHTIGYSRLAESVVQQLHVYY